MNGIWLVSYVTLWLIVTVLMLAALVLARHIGLLHRRLAPASARMENIGLEIGEHAPELAETDMQGRPVSLGSVRGKQTLLVFFSPACHSCKGLAPALRSIWRSERATTEVVLISLGGDDALNREFATKHKLNDLSIIVSGTLGFKYKVLTPPYGLLVDWAGIVRAKGVVNHLEHLESLINAGELGYPSMESWVQAQRNLHGTAADALRS